MPIPQRGRAAAFMLAAKLLLILANSHMKQSKQSLELNACHELIVDFAGRAVHEPPAYPCCCSCVLAFLAGWSVARFLFAGLLLFACLRGCFCVCLLGCLLACLVGWLSVLVCACVIVRF